MTDPISEPAAETIGQPAGPVKRFGPVVVLLLAMAGIYLTGTHKYLSLDVVAEHRESLQRFVGDNTFLAIAIYTLTYICVVAFSLPGGALLTILGGFLFGTLLGASATVIAATIGATTVFLIARSAVGDVLVRKAGPWIKKLSDGFNDDAFSYLMFLRLVPAFPFFVVNIAPALFNVRLSTYVITTFLGIIPGTIAFTFVGSGLDSIIAAQKTAHEACVAEKGAEQCPFGLDAGALINPQIIAGFVALGVVALIPVVIKRMKARKGKSS
ncbi:MAG: TVP38/TMEM64 family protein [Hyphomicrobiales bacterium]|nr:TVP38/TMEM64 family protein [Hyphomicrobiales bacterium]